MSTASSEDPKSVKQQQKMRPFRRAVLRGLAVVMPPLLTIVLFIWAWTTIDGYVLRPIENVMSETLVFFSMRSGVKDGIPSDVVAEKVRVHDQRNQRVPTGEVLAQIGSVQGIATKAPLHGWRVVSFDYEGQRFVPVAGNRWVPEHVYATVEQSPGKLVLPGATARDVYERYVRVRYLTRWRVIPVFLTMFVGLLYLLGKFLAAGVGRMFWAGFESLIRRLPIVRNVYSSVKQVTDFIFSEREVEYTRVVAVQYPRKGIWSVGFVTGESMLDIRSAANEAVLSVLMPTSPMPATGFTITVRKSETVDLDITIDQAIQFIVSCGVVVPLNQQQDEVRDEIASALASRMREQNAELPAQVTPTTPAEPSENGDEAQPGDRQTAAESQTRPDRPEA